MPTAQAIIETENPARYLARLGEHASQMGQRLRHHRPRHHDGGEAPPEVQHAEWSGTDGIVRLNRGQWTMQAVPGELRLRAEADNEADLQLIQDLITVRLERFGTREQLKVNWQQPGNARHQSRRALGTLAGGTPLLTGRVPDGGGSLTGG